MIDNSEAICIEIIWEQFSNPLKSFIKRRVKDNQDVEDILQNVFCKILSNIGSLRGTDKVYAWIYKIARNSIIDFYRAQKFEIDMPELSDNIVNDIEDESTDNKEIAQCLKAMIMYLPEEYKQALILTEFENLTQKALSEKMGISLPGAKSRVQRARTKLKKMLLDCCQLELDRRGNIIDYKHKCSDCKFC